MRRTWYGTGDYRSLVVSSSLPYYKISEFNGRYYLTGRKRLVRPLFTKQRANLVQMHTYPKNDEIHDSLRGLATTRPESTVGREPPQKLKKTRKIRRTLGVLQIRIRCDTSITHTHTQPRARPIEKLLHNSSSGTTYRRTYKEVTPHSPSQQGLSRGRRPQTRNNKIKTANHAVTSRSCHTSSFLQTTSRFLAGQPTTPSAVTLLRNKIKK